MSVPESESGFKNILINKFQTRQDAKLFGTSTPEEGKPDVTVMANGKGPTLDLNIMSGIDEGVTYTQPYKFVGTVKNPSAVTFNYTATLSGSAEGDATDTVSIPTGADPYQINPAFWDALTYCNVSHTDPGDLAKGSITRSDETEKQSPKPPASFSSFSSGARLIVIDPNNHNMASYAVQLETDVSGTMISTQPDEEPGQQLLGYYDAEGETSFTFGRLSTD